MAVMILFPFGFIRRRSGVIEESEPERETVREERYHPCNAGVLAAGPLFLKSVRTSLNWNAFRIPNDPLWQEFLEIGTRTSNDYQLPFPGARAYILPESAAA